MQNLFLNCLFENSPHISPYIHCGELIVSIRRIHIFLDLSFISSDETSFTALCVCSRRPNTFNFELVHFFVCCKQHLKKNQKKNRYLSLKFGLDRFVREPNSSS